MTNRPDPRMATLMNVMALLVAGVQLERSKSTTLTHVERERESALRGLLRANGKGKALSRQ